MKPCASRRESLALLACGLCSEHEAADLQHHLRSCPGCRTHFHQVTVVCDEHTTAAVQLPEVEVPARFFHRIHARIRSDADVETPRPHPIPWLSWGRIVGWAALGLLLAIPALRFAQPFEESLPSPRTLTPQPMSSVAVKSTGGTGNNLSAYRLALNRSPEALEELLSKEATQATPAPQIALRTSPDSLGIEL